MKVIELLCLANSYRDGGRCIAGIGKNRAWIRPVSSGTGALDENRCRHFGLLDVIQVKVGDHEPEPHQPENWVLVDPGIVKVRTMKAVEAARVLEPAIAKGPELLGTRSRFIEHDELVRTPAKASLAVIAPSEIEWIVGARQGGGKQIRCSFSLAGQHYQLPVTDPWWIGNFKSVAVGQQTPPTFGGVGKRDHLLFTISLGSPVGGKCYKLIAGVIILKGVVA